MGDGSMILFGGYGYNVGRLDDVWRLSVSGGSPSWTMRCSQAAGVLERHWLRSLRLEVTMDGFGRISLSLTMSPLPENIYEACRVGAEQQPSVLDGPCKLYETMNESTLMPSGVLGTFMVALSSGGGGGEGEVVVAQLSATSAS
ncbi:unnamed protein product [Symbiodinium natans]|uniref:Uncharacterized protein n=1 Tax=Symbiodinium natans TaxID=878477 RepID=A0A812HI63_9DINO|nr:unnamed protein product [Symbiodinium natans]